MFRFRSISCIFTFGVLTSLARAFVQRSMSLDGSLTNLQFYDGKLYIGGTDRIYVINEDLSKYQAASTCDRPKTTCGNVNQLLLVNKFTKELLVCGTGHNGICEVRQLDNINFVTRNSSRIQAPLKVSADASRPAQALVTQNGNLTVAVTYGKGINVIETWGRYYLSYKYAISTRKFDDFEPVSSKAGTKVLNVEIKDTHFHDYTIYYKAGFQVNWYTYFVTNQKDYVGGSYYLSKLVRLCQNDTDFNSYTDIVLQCMQNGTAYNLIQDAMILRPRNLPKNASQDAIFVGVFFRGNDPNKPTGDSVICLSMLKDIDYEILIAKKKHALACQRQDPSRRYLPNLKSSSKCFNETDLKFRDYDFSCENAYPTFLYVIGNTTISMESRYKVNARDGFVTTVNGEVTGEGNAVVFIGTSKGNIFQMSQSNLNSSLEVFSQVSVGDAVRRIYIKDEDTFYVMGNRKVFLLQRSNCSEFNTCYDTVKGRNPLCGWCVYKQRATRRTDCPTAPNHWISSLQNCRLNMSVTPSSIPVLESSKTNVSLTIVPGVLPERLHEDEYICYLLNGSEVIATVVPKIKGEDFTCTLPRIQDHTEATLLFSVRTLFMNIAVLSTSPLLFFECNHFRRCGECINRSVQNCVWCTEEASCKANGSPCTAELKHSEDVCPRLKDMRGQYFVHTSVMTSVNFYAEHIPKTAYVYTCKVLSSTHSSTAIRSGDSIFCSINITNMLDVPKQDYKVKVNYAAQGHRTVELDDDFGNFVTVYSCSILATDCIHCQALNKSRFNCNWCANKGVCGYTDESCIVKSCPAPNITQVLPGDGPTIGQTKITVFGYNLGSDISDVESIEVANVACNLSKNTDDFLVTNNADFTSHIPSRQGIDEYPIRLTFNEVTSNALIEALKGSATRNERLNCLFVWTMQHASVTADNLRGVKITEGVVDADAAGSSEEQAKIVCYTGPSENETSGFLKMTVKGKVSVSPLKYSYKIPVITTIHPRYGPKAGGTRITIDGQNLEIGNRKVSIMLGNRYCLRPAIKPDIPLDYVFSGNGTIVCTVDAGYSDNVTALSLSIDGAKVINNTPIHFFFVDDPLIYTIASKKGFLSGGTKISIEGKGVTNANEARVSLKGEVKLMVGECEIKSHTLVICKVPRAPQGVADELLQTNGSSECPGCIRKTAVLNLDNVVHEFEIEFYRDPEIYHIEEENGVIKLKSSQRRLTINGKRLNQVATIFDINVTVGMEPCVLAQLKPLFISCIAPRYSPKPGIPNGELPEINVTIGNIRKIVGYVQYEDDINGAMVIIVSAAIVVGLIFVICLGTCLLYQRSRRAKRKLKIMETVTGNCHVMNRFENNGLYTDINDCCLTGIYSNEELHTPTSQEQRANEENPTDLYMTPVYRSKKSKQCPAMSSTPREENPTDLYMTPVYRSKKSKQYPAMSSTPRGHSFRLRHNVTMQIDFETDDKENVVIAPKVLDANLYLHPINGEDNENL